MPGPKVLVVNDNDTMLDLASSRLQAEGFEAQTATTGREGCASCRERRPDLMLLDYHLRKDSPEANASNFVSELRRLCPGVPTVVMLESDRTLSADRFGVDEVLMADGIFDWSTLTGMVRRHIGPSNGACGSVPGTGG
jgi:CheY-like chemotaxis protein